MFTASRSVMRRADIHAFTPRPACRGAILIAPWFQFTPRPPGTPPVRHVPPKANEGCKVPSFGIARDFASVLAGVNSYGNPSVAALSPVASFDNVVDRTNTPATGARMVSTVSPQISTIVASS